MNNVGETARHKQIGGWPLGLAAARHKQIDLRCVRSRDRIPARVTAIKRSRFKILLDTTQDTQDTAHATVQLHYDRVYD